ncbi:hypothetical protein [Amycolatopsis thermoflava]|uniref:hypothetical protein n=1 Tax=Amycolatopsis thermoflava TaxID=84480 RepID=UPI003800B950
MTTQLVQRTSTTLPACWRRRPNALDAPTAPRIPQPVQLYTLLAFTLDLHGPLASGGRCEACSEPWPCESVRLAYRLREGF